MLDQQGNAPAGARRRRGWALVLATLMLAACWGTSPDDHLKAARERLARGDGRGAVLEAKSLLSLRPDHPEGRLLLGRALLAAGDPQAAAIELERAESAGAAAAQVLPALAQAWLANGQGTRLLQHWSSERVPADARQVPALLAAVAEAELGIGNPEAARELLDRAVALAPDDAAVHVLRARAQAGQGMSPASRLYVDDLLRRFPKHAQVLLLHADLLRAEGAELAQVDEAYAAALAVDARMVRAHESRIAAHIAAGQLGKAREHLAAMQKAAPGNAQAQLMDATLALLEGNATRAREISQPLLKSAPKHPKVLLVAGLAELRLGAVSYANSLLTQAVAEDPAAPAPRHALADSLVRAGQATRALDVLSPLIGPASKDTKALALAARAHLLLGDARAADAAFARGLAIAPKDPELRAARAMSRLARGDAAALGELDAIAASDSEPSTDYMLVAARLNRGEFDKADQAAVSMGKKMPQHPLPDLLRGDIAQRKKDWNAARQHYEAALTKDAGYLLAVDRLTALDVREGKPDAARQRFQALLKKQPNHTDAMLAHAEFLRRIGAPRAESVKWLDEAVKKKPDDAVARMALVDHHLRGGDARGTLQAAQQASAALPDNAELLQRLAEAQLRAGDVAQARQSFGKVLTLRPRTVAPALGLARAYEAAGQGELAWRQVLDVIEFAPTAVEPFQHAVGLALRQKQPQRALEMARALQKAHPGQGVGYWMEGGVHVVARNWGPAIASLREAVKRPGAGDAPAELYAALMSADKAAEALAFETSWTKSRPTDAAFVLRLADHALERRDVERAELRYRKAVQMVPGNAWALNNLATIQIAKGEKQALDTALKAVAAAPDRAEVRDTLAHAYAAARNFDKAIETQQEALALAPRAPALRVALVRLHLKAGQKDKARTELERLERESPPLVSPEALKSLRNDLK
jgi:cellulose synthase operon protein C